MLFSNLFRKKTVDVDNVTTVSSLRELIHTLNEQIDIPTPSFLKLIDDKKNELKNNQNYENLIWRLQFLKIVNVLINKHEYRKKKINKIGKPIGFLLDPANGCHVGCATCINSFNVEYVNKIFNKLPKGLMKEDQFDFFCNKFAPFSYNAHFYNYSEPFMNPRTPMYIKKAHYFHNKTYVSSNLSIPNLDHEAVVLSGLIELHIALDGATSESYKKYRRGGDFDLILYNVKKIVELKKKFKSLTPYLRWQFLTFEHNKHEHEKAIEMAREIGFDSFNFATPYDVSADDPTTFVCEAPKGKDGAPYSIHFANNSSYSPMRPTSFPQDLSEIKDTINSLFEENYISKLKQEEEDEDLKFVKGSDAEYCDWLHLATSIDAKGRVMPCCIADNKGGGNMIFGSLQEDADNIMNTEWYKMARKYHTNKNDFLASKQDPKTPVIRCETCKFRPTPQVGIGSVESYILENHQAYSHMEPMNDTPTIEILARWSQHTLVSSFL